MAANKYISRFVLLPASKIFRMIVGVRNTMFNWHILKQRKFDVPIVVVGNLAVGGTGKTPHAEYIINMLKDDYHVGVLSRGYKRKTKGFVLATSRSTPMDIGDEPYQIYHKFGREVAVAVCENRCHGIEELLKIDPSINLIVLDDAFQHRYVKPTVSVVLTEFNMPVFYDKMLPLGRLREPLSSLNRANIVVVTKCPERLKPLEYRIFQRNLGLMPYQQLFFSRYTYPQLRPVFPEDTRAVPNLSWFKADDSILALSGIANPKPFVKRLKSFEAKVKIKVFADHHNFTRKDMRAIVERYNSMTGNQKIIVTTEKDAVRLANNPYFPQELKSVIFYQPIEVTFDQHGPESFDIALKQILRQHLVLDKQNPS